MGRRGGGRSTRFRSVRRFFGFGGLPQDTEFILRRVAIAKGLRDVDELLVKLGKEGQSMKLTEAFDLLEKEGGSNAVSDAALTLYYQRGKGYENCNHLLKMYTDTVQKADDPTMEFVLARSLKLYCSYTDDELQALKLSS